MKTRNVLTVLLSAALVLSLVPAQALAEITDAEAEVTSVVTEDLADEESAPLENVEPEDVGQMDEGPEPTRNELSDDTDAIGTRVFSANAESAEVSATEVNEEEITEEKATEDDSEVVVVTDDVSEDSPSNNDNETTTTSEAPSGDDEPPVIDAASLSVSAREAAAGDVLTFSVGVADESGFSYGSLLLVHPESGKSHQVSLRYQDGVATGTFSVKDGTMPGEWHVEWVHAADPLGNGGQVYDLRHIPSYGSYATADLSAADFVVVGTSGDDEPPVIDAASLSVSAREAAAGDVLTFSVGVADESGFSYGSLLLVHPESGKSHQVSLRYQDGVATGTFSVKDGTMPGEWHVEWVHAADPLGNGGQVYDLRHIPSYGSYATADLSAADFVVVPSGYCHISFVDGFGGSAFDDIHYIVAPGDVTPVPGEIASYDDLVFDGWSPAVSETVVGSITYTAKWKTDGRPIYTVTFSDGCGGAVFPDELVYVRQGDSVTVPKSLVLTRQGYLFAGWDTPLSQAIDTDITYVAKWTPNADYVVAIDEGPIEIAVTNSSISSVTNFSGWKTTNADLGYISGQEIRVSSSGVTVRTTFYPQQEGFATFYATHYNGARTIGSCTIVVTPSNKIDVATLESSLDSYEVPYRPDGACPKVLLIEGENELIDGTDYVVEYVNNMAVGTAEAVITGKGNYRNEVRIPFEVVAREIGEAQVVASDYTYDGTSATGNVTVTDGDVVLSEGTDYTLSYEGACTELGVYSVQVTGMGNYTGTTTAEFSVTRRPVTVSADSVSKTYGDPDPELTALVDGLVDGETVSYTLNRGEGEDAGDYAIAASGDEIQGNYTVSYVSGTFTIVPADISMATVGPIESVEFDGATQCPKPVVSIGQATLVEDVDYTVSYSDNVNAGTATVTITGKANYAGTTTATFDIAPKSLNYASLSEIADQTYDGSEHKPEVTVELEGELLSQDIDYNVSYANDVNAGTATVTVTGKGNYAGECSTGFEIKPADLTNAVLAVDSQQVLQALLLSLMLQ